MTVTETKVVRCIKNEKIHSVLFWKDLLDFVENVNCFAELAQRSVEILETKTHGILLNFPVERKHGRLTQVARIYPTLNALETQ